MTFFRAWLSTNFFSISLFLKLIFFQWTYYAVIIAVTIFTRVYRIYPLISYVHFECSQRKNRSKNRSELNPIRLLCTASIWFFFFTQTYMHGKFHYIPCFVPTYINVLSVSNCWSTMRDSLQFENSFPLFVYCTQCFFPIVIYYVGIPIYLFVLSKRVLLPYIRGKI